MKIRPSTVLLLVFILFLNMGVSAYVSQSIITRSPQPLDYSPEIRELRSEIRNLSERFDILIDFVESKHGLIWDMHTVETNKTDILFQDREVVIGLIAATSSGYSDYVPFVKEIIEPDLNDLAYGLGSDIGFSFEVSDAQGQAAIHLEQVQYLSSQGVNLVIGGMWSSQACASLSYCNYNDIILFSPSSTSPLPAIEGDNLFRLAPTDVKQPVVIAKMLRSRGVEAIVLIQRGDAWADAIYNFLEDEFNELGGVVVEKIRYPGESAEFSKYLETAEAAALEAVDEYGWGKVAVELVSFAEVSTILGQCKDYPTLYNLTWFGSDGTVHSQQMIDEVPEEAGHVKLYSVQPVLPDSDESRGLSLRYENVTSSPLDYYTACSYDIAMILGTAVIEADTIDTDTLKAKIHQVCEDYQGVTGLCRLDSADDRATSNFGIYSYSLKEGEFGCWEVGMYTDNREIIWYED